MLAEVVGLEPTTRRLTAGCSTIELYLQIGDEYGIRTHDNIRVKGARVKPLLQLAILNWWTVPDSNR